MIHLWIFNLILILSLCFSVPSSFAEPPQRIVSLAPNITEILYAIGLGDRITGVTLFCDYPDEAKKKTKVGGMSNPSLEAVISLEPDIVIMTTDGNPKEFEERLHSLKIRTYVFRARRLSEFPQGIRDLGTALGAKERADMLAGGIETTIKKYRASNLTLNSKPSGHRTVPINHHFTGGRDEGTDGHFKKKVLFIIWPEPLIAAGPGTAIDDAISLLGMENIASKARASYPKYSVEEIIRQSPDIIFIGKGHSDVKEITGGLLKKIAMVPAVSTGKVFYLSDKLYRLGPRVAQGIEEMAGCLR